MENMDKVIVTKPKDTKISMIILFIFMMFASIFLISIVTYELTKDVEPEPKQVIVDVKTNGYFNGVEYAIKYLNESKYLKKDIKLDLKYFLDDLNTEKDSLSYDQYFYNGFNYTLKYMDKNGYLMKTKIIIELDSLIVNCNRYNKRFYNK